MPLKQLITAVLAGFGLMMLGFTSAPVRLKAGMDRFRDALEGVPHRSQNLRLNERLPGQIWLTVGGAAMVLLALAAYRFGW